MEKLKIDKFFESLSKDVLKTKWAKYNSYSDCKNKVKVTQLIENWRTFYGMIFTLDENEIEDKNKIKIKKSEPMFGFFLYLNHYGKSRLLLQKI